MSWYVEDLPSDTSRFYCKRKDCGSFKHQDTALAEKVWTCANGHENRVERVGQKLRHSTNMGLSDVLRALAGVEMEPVCDVAGCQFIGWPVDRGRHKHQVRA